VQHPCLDVADLLPISPVDEMSIARLESMRASVSRDLRALNDQIDVSSKETEFLECGAMSSTAFDSLQTFVFQWWYTDISGFLGQDPRLIEERKALRRLLRFLNKLINIARRREAFDCSLRKIVLTLAAFFVTHGNHPPRPPSRRLWSPEGCAV
jgi:hypothetical protein